MIYLLGVLGRAVVLCQLEVIFVRARIVFMRFQSEKIRVAKNQRSMMYFFEFEMTMKALPCRAAARVRNVT